MVTEMSSSLSTLCMISAKGVGGQSVRAAGVYGRIGAAGIRGTIGVYRDAKALAAFFKERNIATVTFDAHAFTDPRRLMSFLRYAFSMPIGLVRIARYLRKEGIDLVHVNGAFDIVPALATRLAGKKLVWHLNDTVFPPLPSRILGRIVRALAHEIPVAATRVGEHYGVPRSRSQLLPAPVEITRFPARDPDRISGQAPLLGMVGNWNWVKGQNDFVDVIVQLRERGIAARGQIVGSFVKGQESFFEPIIERIKNAGLDNEIGRPGFCDDVPSEISQFDISLLTSRSEACPICVLEAMSVGVPVVAYDVGGTSEMLGEGNDAAGIVVPPGDSVAMTEAVQKLLGNPERYRRMARNGQARARAQFSLEACIARHIEIYRKAMGTPS